MKLAYKVKRTITYYELKTDLKSVCGDKKISMRQLARRVGISPAYLTDINRGRRYLTDDMKCRIEMALAGKSERGGDSGS